MMEKEFIYEELAKILGNTRMDGFQYLVEAVCLKDNYNKFGELIEAVAVNYNTTYSRVDRAIRYHKGLILESRNVQELLSIAIIRDYPISEYIQNCYDYCKRQSNKKSKVM